MVRQPQNPEFRSYHENFQLNVLKFETLVACQNSLNKQCRPRSESYLFAILAAVLLTPALKTNIVFENRKRKMLKILEH